MPFSPETGPSPASILASSPPSNTSRHLSSSPLPVPQHPTLPKLQKRKRAHLAVLTPLLHRRMHLHPPRLLRHRARNSSSAALLRKQCLRLGHRQPRHNHRRHVGAHGARNGELRGGGGGAALRAGGREGQRPERGGEGGHSCVSVRLVIAACGFGVDCRLRQTTGRRDRGRLGGSAGDDNDDDVG